MIEDELTPTRRQFPRIPSENVVMIHRIGPTEQMRLKITIENEVVEATGKVVWEKLADDGTMDVGVAFISIDSAHSDTILAQMWQADAS